MQVSVALEHDGLPGDREVISLRAREALSELFEVRATIVTASAIDLAPLLGTSASVELAPTAPDSVVRYFHGVIDAAAYLGADGHRHHYRFVLRPRLRSLAQRVRTRIFQNLSAVDIVKQVLEGAGVPADKTRWSLIGEPPPREHCCQWKESELAFVLRLLTDEGIFFWFEHSQGDHILCFGDGPTAHAPIDGDTVLGMRAHEAQETESLWDPVLSTQIVYDAYRSRDFTHGAPSAPLEAQHGEGARLLYEHPGGYDDGTRGAALAQARWEEASRDRVVLEAASDCARAMPGRRFHVGAVEPPLFDAEHLVVSVDHSFDRAPDGVTRRYENHLRAIPVEVPFRPSRVTPRPRASGLETAVVTGPDGEEIHVDELGRIKVHFYWDREGAIDDTSSAWVRFQQLNTSGAMVLPRVGWEVHVAFLDGDPDRPVAVHKVMNDETMPSYALPAHKTRSALQSSTSPAGGSTNEIRLEDASGTMEWYLHASRDLRVSVAHDERESVGVDSSESVGGTYQSSVGGNETATVGGDQSVTIAADASVSTVGDKALTVGGNDDTGIASNFEWTTGGDRTESIGSLMTVLANSVTEVFGANHVREVGAVLSISSATSIAETVGGDKTETVSAAKVTVTPKSYEEQVSGLKVLASGAASITAGGDVEHTTKGAFALTAVAGIEITCDAECAISGSQVRLTTMKATLTGGGSRVDLGTSLTIDASKLGAEGGPLLTLKGNIDYT